MDDYKQAGKLVFHCETSRPEPEVDWPGSFEIIGVDYISPNGTEVDFTDMWYELDGNEDRILQMIAGEDQDEYDKRADYDDHLLSMRFSDEEI
jgi:hypothetical protein